MLNKLKQVLCMLKAFNLFKAINVPIDWTEQDEHNLHLFFNKNAAGNKLLSYMTQCADNALKASVLSQNPPYSAGLAAGYIIAINEIMRMAQVTSSDIAASRGEAENVVKHNHDSANSGVKGEYSWKM